ncbi:MAG: dephospho-CoA kinase [Campylobacterales bacterium]|nr:dephospho-CoA kinase [Campylobacterales bacterium]
MNKQIFKYAIALTGGIATGKSTVSKLLLENNFHIIDADLIAHTILDDNYSQIISLFGQEYVENKKVIRKRLGKLIFSKIEEKEKLENLLHPLIKKEIENQAKVEDLKEKIYFIDIPLFFERMHYDISKCLVIYINKNIQIQRLKLRDNINEKEALLKISNQIPIDDKKEKADYVINNEDTLENLRIKVKNFIKEII